MGNRGEIFEFVLDEKAVFAGFSTRFGGFSKGVYESLNLGLHVGDKVENVLKNREVLRKFLGVKRLVFMEQIHSDVVKILKNENESIGKCDAVITNLKNVGLCVMVADCSPVLLYDGKNSVVSAIHAGRAGVVSKILSKTARLMQSEFGSNLKELKAFVGASISSECYEIGDMDLGEFNMYKNGKNFSMQDALKDEFIALDITDIRFSQSCTFLDKRYFSYRRDGITGRFAGVIGLR